MAKVKSIKARLFVSLKHVFEDSAGYKRDFDPFAVIHRNEKGSFSYYVSRGKPY